MLAAGAGVVGTLVLMLREVGVAAAPAGSACGLACLSSAWTLRPSCDATSVSTGTLLGQTLVRQEASGCSTSSSACL